MDSLSFREKVNLFRRRRSMDTDCGVLDRGLYYLVAIVLKDVLEGEIINLSKKKRDFLQEMLELHYSNLDSTYANSRATLYHFLLEKILEHSCTLHKWKKWTRIFVYEYQRHVDVILGSEMKFAEDILTYYPELAEGILAVDYEEEYMDKTQIGETFRIQEMIPAVQRFCSQTVPSMEEPEELAEMSSSLPPPEDQEIDEDPTYMLE